MFRAALNAELASIREVARVRMLALVEKAVDALEDVLENGEIDGARTAAVRLILERVGITNSGTGGLGDAMTVGPVDRRRLVVVDNLDSISAENRRRLSAANVVLLDANKT